MGTLQIAKTITVNQQTCLGQTGTPKVRTRRTVPMTATLHDALKRMSTVREGFVARNLDGTAKTDKQAVWRSLASAGSPAFRSGNGTRFDICMGTMPRCSV